MIRKNNVTFLTLLLVALMLGIFAGGCNMEHQKQNEEYVASVKQLVNDAVTYTRAMREQADAFDCQNTASGKDYIEVLTSIEDICSKLLALDTPEYFAESGGSLHAAAQDSLDAVSEIKGLAVYALDNKDDTLYRRSVQELTERYQTGYESVVNCSSLIQTDWRNA